MGGEHERVIFLPLEMLDLWLPLCAFLMHFGCFGPKFQWVWLRSFERIIYYDKT